MESTPPPSILDPLRSDIRPTHSINEGGGERLTLADGRQMIGLSVGEKGTLPVRITAVGEAGHASVPTLGRNAVPLLAQLLPRLGDGMPEPSPAPEAVAMLQPHHEVLPPALGIERTVAQRPIGEGHASAAQGS